MLWATLAALIVLCLLGFDLRDAGTAVHLLIAFLGSLLIYNLVYDTRRALSSISAGSGNRRGRFQAAAQKSAIDKSSAAGIEGA